VPVQHVNPRGGTVHSLPTYSRLADIGEPVDLALIIVPPLAVLSVFQDMADMNIRNAVLITAGFGELGAEGKEMQQELIDFAHTHDIAFLGPNCLGMAGMLCATLMYPRQLGPRKAMSCVCAKSMSSCCISLPSAPSSPKPAVMRTALRMFISAMSWK